MATTQDCRRGCTTRPTSRRTSRRRASSTRTSSACRCSRPGASRTMLFGAERTYCHLFFGLADGGALAFFQFANTSDQELFGPKMPETPFHHIALNVDAETQDGIEQRLQGRGLQGAADRSCSSTATAARCTRRIPNGMIVEFTVDHPDVEKINATQRADAHAELKRWLGGRSHLEQHVPLEARRVRSEHRPDPDDARRQPAALAGRHRRAVRARARRPCTDASAAARTITRRRGAKSCAGRWKPASTSSATAR